MQRLPFIMLVGMDAPPVRELLKDSRVKVNEPQKDGYTSLWSAAADGHLDVIKWWIASGREMDLGKPGDVDFTDAIAVAKQNGRTEVVTLLERFKNDAAQTRSDVRKELESMVRTITTTIPSCSYSSSFFILSS